MWGLFDKLEKNNFKVQIDHLVQENLVTREIEGP